MSKYTELKKTLSYTRKLYENSMIEDNSVFMKNTLLFDAIRGNTQLVKEKSNYPKNGEVTVDLEVDLVIMSRSEFEKLKKNE